jgi:glycogen debranching enzyme
MSNEGFNNKIGVDCKTGFVFGGNRWNCGTWMDKMGSSETAGNKGHPGSPRDGSAVELVGLSRAVINWLIQMIDKGFYPYNEQKSILENWLKKIDENFEKEFWIDETNSSQYVNRKQIYKDTVNSTLKWTDFQFRPNFLIAAVVVSFYKTSKFN